MAAEDRVRDFAGRRWLTVVLRSMHLVAVIWLGAALIGSTAGDPLRTAHALVSATGAAIFALDLWHRPSHLRECAGIGMLVKLLLVAAMAVVPQHALALFWAIVVYSALVSHAPASFRHARIVGR